MDLELRGAKALVTGGTRGVGRGIVRALVGAGAHVITCCRQEGEAVASLEQELKESVGDHHVVRADLARVEEIDRLFTEVESRFGHLDVVVNNAAAVSRVPFDQLPTEEWRRTVDTNLTAPALIIQRSLPMLREGSSVISLGSKAVDVGVPQQAHYNATKAALVGLSRSLAREFGSKGIRFNVLALGVIETEAMAAMPAEQSERIRQWQSQKTALGRLGRPDEVGDVVLFLASRLSRYVTGATIHVDGGIA